MDIMSESLHSQEPRARPPIDLGGCRIRVVSGGSLKLDGGAMFGIIPKPLWTRGTPADEQNRIQLACNCLLVEWDGSAGRRAIVETGHGAKYAEKERSIFGIDVEHWLENSLRGVQVDPLSITDVFLTHLHFDHAGGLTTNGPERPATGEGAATGGVETPPASAEATKDGLQASAEAGLDTHGRDRARPLHSERSERALRPTFLATGLRPTFPAATVHVQRREFEDARANFGIMTITYREENFAPIDAAGLWRLHDGEAAPLPGVRLIPTPGHTRGHQSVLIEGRERAVLFLGDVMPTRNHVGLPYNMGYDVLPLDNRDTKARILRMAAERDWLVVIDHDPVTPIVRVRPDGRHFVLEPA